MVEIAFTKARLFLKQLAIKDRSFAAFCKYQLCKKNHNLQEQQQTCKKQRENTLTKKKPNNKPESIYAK